MSDFEEQEKRIAKILGEDEVPQVNKDALRRFLGYLKKNLRFPCLLTGIEDFKWEEYYIIGPGSKEEHERLRKANPSYMDAFELLSFDEEVDVDNGIFVRVRRTSDKKKFVLPLAELKATIAKQSKNYQLLDDFSVWFWNYR